MLITEKRKLVIVFSFSENRSPNFGLDFPKLLLADSFQNIYLKN